MELVHLNKRLKLSPSVEVNESTECCTSIDCLPDEILEIIFGYFKFHKLCMLGCVCKKWYEVSRRPFFWRRIDVKYSASKRLDSQRANRLIKVLPSFVTHLRLEFGPRRKKRFPKLSMTLRERFPNLQVLILRDISINHLAFDKALDSPFLGIFPENLQILILQHCRFNAYHSRFRKGSSLKVEVFDIGRSPDLSANAIYIASMLPQLRKFGASGITFLDNKNVFFPYVISKLEVLDLEGAIINSETFAKIWQFGQNLKELYICHTSIQDEDFNEAVKNPLPHLETLCIRGTGVTVKSVNFLLSSNVPLKQVIMDEKQDKWPFSQTYDYIMKQTVSHITYLNKLSVKMYCDHHTKIDYMNKK